MKKENILYEEDVPEIEIVSYEKIVQQWGWQQRGRQKQGWQTRMPVSVTVEGNSKGNSNEQGKS